MATVDTQMVDLLNELTEITIDSVKGYDRASEEVKSDTLKAMFGRRASERRAIVAELQTLVRDMGGEPETEDSWLSRAHRAFLDLKSAIAGDSDKAILEEVERGEDHLRDKWQEKLAAEYIPLSLRTELERHLTSIKAGHDEVSDMKHAAEATR